MQMDSVRTPQHVTDPSQPLLKTADRFGARCYTNTKSATTDEDSLASYHEMRGPDQKHHQKSEVDGCRAWFTLACVFIINANTLGSLKVYGLIFREIVSQEVYTREEAAWPISTASTVQNLAGKLNCCVY